MNAFRTTEKSLLETVTTFATMRNRTLGDRWLRDIVRGLHDGSLRIERAAGRPDREHRSWGHGAGQDAVDVVAKLVGGVPQTPPR